MTTQINLRINDKLFSSAKKYAEDYGYENIQDFIREAIREKVFEEDITQREIALAEKLNILAEKHELYGSMKDIEKLIERKGGKN